MADEMKPATKFSVDEYVPDSSTVFTPQQLAAAMVRAGRDTSRSLWLDPCVGDGAFIAELAALGVRRDRILALDIAPAPGARDCFARTSRAVDFVEWAQQHGAAVDRVVMNPPYVALSRVRGRPLQNALQVTLADGKPLPFKANYWCAFVLRAVECLRQGGSLVAVLPAAWDFAKYAAPVRDSVARSFGEVTVIRCASPLFPTVQDGAVVVACARRGDRPCTVRRVEVPDLAGMVRALDDVAQGRVPRGASVVRGLAAAKEARIRLDEVVDIRIGAVTGDAHYFLLSEIERTEMGLPRSAVCPVLSKSKHLSTAVMDDREWEALRDAGARVWLFRPARAALSHPAVKKYLQRGQQGDCNVQAFKISSRNPWHRTPLPRGIDGFMSGMSKRLPFLVLREMRGLTATNTLYVIRFRKPSSAAEKAALGVVLLTSGVRKELACHARVYADGLLKFEPTELGSVRIPIVVARRDAPDVLRRATALLLQGEEEEASLLADAWVTAVTSGGACPSVPRRGREVA